MGRISDSKLVNLTDLKIIRVTRTTGGDISGKVTQAENLRAYYEPKESRVRELSSGRDVTISAKFWIDPIDNDGDPIDVDQGDFVTYTDWRGEASPEREIITVTPQFCGTTLSHLEMEVGS